MSARALTLALAVLLPLGAAAQQQQREAPGGGAPAVQSTLPEVGAGRGGINNQVPETTDKANPTGQTREASPNAGAERPPQPVTEIPAPPPFTDRPAVDAAELELQHALRGGIIDGAVSIPNQAAGILIQPQGREWRQFRTWWLYLAGAVLVLGPILVLAGLYFWKGPNPISAGRSGRWVDRYSLLERTNHWMVAGSFVVLALSGLNITFGAHLIRPVIGAEAFTALTIAGQAAHQFLSFPFVLGLLVMAALWTRDNLPAKVDIAWIRAGGPVAKGHPPAGRFNAAQKALFFYVVGGGAVAAVSGYLLMLPNLLDNVTAQQWAHVVHGLMAMVLIAGIIGHIYIGTIGTEGAFEAMSQGHVDLNYAREHHSAWVEEKLADAQRLVREPPPGAVVERG